MIVDGSVGWVVDRCVGAVYFRGVYWKRKVWIIKMMWSLMSLYIGVLVLGLVDVLMMGMLK